MSDLTNRQDVIEAVMNTEPVVFDVQTLEPHQKTKDVIAAIEAVPSAQPEERTEERTETHTCDCISRQAAIDALYNYWSGSSFDGEGYDIADKSEDVLNNLPSAQPERKKEKWTTEEVAEILFNAFGDDCACNFNGIDEWLPERCKYTEIADECPEPKEKHGCWMQFLLQGGADMRGEQE